MTIYSFDLKSRRIGTMDYPEAIVVPSEPVVWDAASHGGAFVLSNGNLTASKSTQGYVFCTPGQSTGKRYVELALVGGVGGMDTQVGIRSSASVLAYARHAYGDQGTSGGTGTEWFAIGLTTDNSKLITPVTGDRVCMCVDFSAGKMWLGVNGSYPSGSNPVTGAGAAVSAMPAGTYVVVYGADNDGAEQSATLYAQGDSAFLFGPPSGFTAGWA